MNIIDSATRDISHFLYQLILPIDNKHNNDSTIIDSDELIKRLDKYANDGHLQVSTLFCIFGINNFYIFKIRKIFEF